jgi:hypothetical protein
VSTARAITVAVVAVLLSAAGASAGPAKADGKTKTSVWFQSGPGPARRVFTMKQPSGVVLLTRLTTTYGIRASVAARIPGVAGVGISQAESSSSCRRHGSLEICTQSQEGCPMPKAVWRIHVLKTGGPAGLVRFDFVVGKPT